MSEFERCELIIEKEVLNAIQVKHVCVFGVGGVGGHCIESLARMGIKHISIVDYDVVSLSNVNRQIIALHSTIGKKKVEVMKERLLDINPTLQCDCYDMFVGQDTIHEIDFSNIDYIVDAVDNVTAKLLIIEKAKEANVPIISCMGTGNKLYPEQLKIMDIYETKYCPLAKVMRKELKNRKIKKLKVLSSYEQPMKGTQRLFGENGKMIPGSVSFVPSAAGILICSEVVHDLMKKR